jgi:hypothetical protein
MARCVRPRRVSLSSPSAPGASADKLRGGFFLFFFSTFNDQIKIRSWRSATFGAFLTGNECNRFLRCGCVVAFRRGQEHSNLSFVVAALAFPERFYIQVCHSVHVAPHHARRVFHDCRGVTFSSRRVLGERKPVAREESNRLPFRAWRGAATFLVLEVGPVGEVEISQCFEG